MLIIVLVLVFWRADADLLRGQVIGNYIRARRSSGYGGFAQQRAWEQVAMSSIDHTPDQLRDETRPRGATLILVALAAILLFMMLSPRTPVVSDRGIGPRAVTESPGPIPSTERRPKPYP